MNEDYSVAPYEPRNGAGLERREEYHSPALDYWAGEPDAAESIPWRRYLAAVFRYKWLLVLALSLGLAGAYGVWRSIAPSYVAQGSLWLQSDQGSSQGPITTGGLLQSSAWIELLNSYTVLDSVVREEQLYLRPANSGDLSMFEDFELDTDFVPGSYTLTFVDQGRAAQLIRNGTVIDEASANDSIGASLGFRWTVPDSGIPSDRNVSFSVVPPRDAATQLRGGLRTQLDRQGNFLRVELQGTDPQRISRVLNAVMERLVDVAATLKSGSLLERREALAEQLADVEEELRTAERNLEEFRVQTITLPSERSTPIQPGLEMTRDPVFSDYFQMQVDLESLRREQERLRDILDRGSDGEIPLEMLELIPSSQVSSELRQAIQDLRAARTERRTLLQQYTAEHPAVRELTQIVRELETDIVPGLIQDLVQGLEAEEQVLASRIESAGSDLTEIPPRAIEEARLRRRVALAEQLYRDVRSRYETTNLAEASTIPDIRILDRASPPEVPTNDERIRLAMVIIGGAFGAGMLGAILLDRFDPRVRYPDEVEKRFGLPFLGVIPTVKGAKRAGSEKIRTEAYEAFRELRTSLTYSYGTANPLILAVSSPGQGDGKSFLAANLAMAFADLGKRTLLIDADTRKGHLHRKLGVDRKPGLTDFLAAHGPVNGIARETHTPNLRLIPSGSRLSNSPELLSSARLTDALAEFKSRCDVIIVDTPPLGAGSDAALLSCMAGNLLLVLRSGSTNKELTKAKLEPLRRLPVRVLGMVLNDYSSRGPGTYSYYGNYLPGYETGQEEPSGETVHARLGTA